MKKALGAYIVFILLMSAVPILGEATNYDKMDKAVRAKVESGLSNIDLIIEFYELDDSSRALIPKEKIINEFIELNSIHAILNANEIKNISSSEYVKNIWGNVGGLTLFDTITFSSEDQIVINGFMGADTIKASPLYNIGYKGNGVTVAVLDTGILETHVEFPEGKILYQYDFVNKDVVADDLDGHGTFVSGIISGQAYTTADWAGYYNFVNTTPTNTMGVSPGSKLVILKIIENNQGKLSDYFEACNWLISNKNIYNIRVVNMSAGWDVDSMILSGWPLDGTDPASMAANSVVDKGIVWVNAAGNGGPSLDTIGAPARAKNVITVANAIDRTVVLDTPIAITRAPISIANDSSRGGGYSGLKPDISAPGTQILSSFIGNDYDYGLASGTSFASPFVAGSVAILIQRHPNWTPYQVKIALMRTATPISGASAYEQGAGIVNLNGAFSYRQDFERTSVIGKVMEILKKNKENN
ncbi:MAG: Pyrolysin precursor [Candidatus Methanofastidiosum methylothiophilum]|uniref:Pyrolysin n=1 Tax=Candidatus Methanofastidiosum methylothiophilum TaxID=1705564 RepID=A0A150IP87_9EURY|nr:MAG: Pyrolysin precursor [Candidatus Methanofastidiosum methylthiophilus]